MRSGLFFEGRIRIQVCFTVKSGFVISSRRPDPFSYRRSHPDPVISGRSDPDPGQLIPGSATPVPDCIQFMLTMHLVVPVLIG